VEENVFLIPASERKPLVLINLLEEKLPLISEEPESEISYLLMDNTREEVSVMLPFIRMLVAEVTCVLPEAPKVLFSSRFPKVAVVVPVMF
jgi:hypothetical protein